MIIADTTLQIYCDGGSRGNPGPAASAFVVYSGPVVLHEQGFFLGISTNNQAEYTGVLKSLEWLSAALPSLVNLTTVSYYLDSLLVVNQLKGLYKIKDFHLRDSALKVNSYLSHMKNISVTFSHVPRSQNSRADLLVNQTLDASSLQN